MSTLLTLIRHGQSMWNASGQAQGQSIVPLSEIGHRQAGCIAQSVGDDGTIQALYCSDLIRCRQTMEPIAAALGLVVCYDARLREIDVGAWQGLPFSQIKELDGERWTAFRNDPFGVTIPDGENQGTLRDRVVACIEEITRAHPEQHVLIVLHGGPIYEILRHYGLLTARPWTDEEPQLLNTSRTVLRLHDDGAAAELLLMADVSHLPDDLRI